MKIINNLKSKNAVYSDDTYMIVNVEPDKNGSWLVVKHNQILFASPNLTDAKRYVASFTFYGKDENLQGPIDSTGYLRKKLDTRLKVLELEMMSNKEKTEFFRNIPRVRFGKA